MRSGSAKTAPRRSVWTYDDIRQADSPAGVLRVSCLSAPALARLEIRDAALSAELTSRCARLGENRLGGRASAQIVGWSLAAVASIVMVVLFAIPLAADRLAPLVPQAFERRIGEASEVQIRALFGNKVCDRPAGQAAFVKLLGKLREAAGLDTDVQSSVLSTEYRMPSRCRAARSICSADCWRRPKIPTRSPACSRTNSGI